LKIAPSPQVGPLWPYLARGACFSPTRNVWLVPSVMSRILVRDWVETQGYRI
jgi:hypothetical protein